MTTMKKFRITGKQIDTLIEFINSSKPNAVLISTCGKGESAYQGIQSCCFSVRNNLEAIMADEISIFIEKYPKAPGIIIFHVQPIKELDIIEMLAFDKNIICAYNLANYGKFFLSCFIDFQNKLISSYIYDDGKHEIIDMATVVGDDIVFSFANNEASISEINLRTSQAFGSKTTGILSKLTVGVVGVSGTGSIVAEQLFRLKVGKLVLVDDDIVEEKNLGRIINSTYDDAMNKTSKVDMFADFVNESQIGTTAFPICTVIENPQTIRILSQCDVIFGCVDSISGRHTISKLCKFYSLPYFDVGVGLKADGNGGISSICGAVHYIKPDGTSLIERGVYNNAKLLADNLKRANTFEYEKQLKEKYITNVNEESPAVISVNMILSSLCVNDFLARIHPYRNQDNNEIETIRINLCEMVIFKEKIAESIEIMPTDVGTGDMVPLLKMPSLSERI